MTNFRLNTKLIKDNLDILEKIQCKWGLYLLRALYTVLGASQFCRRRQNKMNALQNRYESHFTAGVKPYSTTCEGGDQFILFVKKINEY